MILDNLLMKTSLEETSEKIFSQCISGKFSIFRLPSQIQDVDLDKIRRKPGQVPPPTGTGSLTNHVTTGINLQSSLKTGKR